MTWGCGKISDLNIRRGPGTNYNTTGAFTGVGVFTIVDNHGIKSYVHFSDIGFESDYTEILDRMISDQNPFLWFMGVPIGFSYKLNQ